MCKSIKIIVWRLLTGKRLWKWLNCCIWFPSIYRASHRWLRSAFSHIHIFSGIFVSMHACMQTGDIIFFSLPLSRQMFEEQENDKKMCKWTYKFPCKHLHLFQLVSTNRSAIATHNIFMFYLHIFGFVIYLSILLAGRLTGWLAALVVGKMQIKLEVCSVRMASHCIASIFAHTILQHARGLRISECLVIKIVSPICCSDDKFPFDVSYI